MVGGPKMVEENGNYQWGGAIHEKRKNIEDLFFTPELIASVEESSSPDLIYYRNNPYAPFCRSHGLP
jgi:hypothetical protein